MIQTCQQDVFKLFMEDGDIYYHKNFVNNQSWWTMKDENLSDREWDVYQKFFMWQIPVAQFKSRSLEYFLSKEANGNTLEYDSIGISYYNVGRVLKKIHHHGYIHGDFNHNNIIVDGLDVSAIIDFEESVPIDGEYPHLPDYLRPDPMYDLATFLRSCRYFEPEKGYEFFNRFLKGYGLEPHLIHGIESWEERIDKRGENFRQWCEENQLESVIC